MPTISMRQLLEAGVHFGHQTRRWNPKMKPFIFAERNGIHIIDLAQTTKRLDVALDFVRETVARGDVVTQEDEPDSRLAVRKLLFPHKSSEASPSTRCPQRELTREPLLARDASGVSASKRFGAEIARTGSLCFDATNAFYTLTGATARS